MSQNQTAIIRIKGQVGIRHEIKETLQRMGLKKKYSCIVIALGEIEKGMLKKVENFVAYGEINKETQEKLKDKKRGKVFHLNPPKGGIKSKMHFPKGVLGNNKDKINELIERMI